MSRLRKILMGIASLILVLQMVLLDYGKTSWDKNTGGYLIILSMVLLIISVIFSHRYDKRFKDE